ncbi:hypothetical protein [Lactiplantibacillus paraplantarum]|uniref:hypothetical protein n=1 Tax=Lactiplantibacillus paraplantarum TaxID=60520 RepID=UPI000E70A152|nr:hypothetical protein [Lactiplantibacillus paraplantarum]RKD21905.1 hypothetical protein BG617_14995 [Lactiplantibacillus paraplantarum]
MEITKKLIKVTPPMAGVYHVMYNNNNLVIIMKCMGSSIYAPVSGTILDFSKKDQVIKIVIDDTESELLIEFPEAGSEISNFYVNKGERITRGLKLAEMKALTGDLIVTNIDLNKKYHYEVCKR